MLVWENMFSNFMKVKSSSDATFVQNVSLLETHFTNFMRVTSFLDVTFVENVSLWRHR